MRTHRRSRNKRVKKNVKNMNYRVQYVNEEDTVWSAYNGTSHKIRHRKKMRRYRERYTERFQVNETETTITNEGPQGTTENITKTVIDYGMTMNQTLTFNNNDPLNFTDPVGTPKVDGHGHCYTTNEVLEIIAVTCLVNFIFWFVIITIVNIFTRKEKVKYRSGATASSNTQRNRGNSSTTSACTTSKASWESVDSVELAPEFEMRFQNELNIRRPITGSDLVDEGIANDLLTPEELKEDDDPFNIGNNYEQYGSDWGILHDEGQDWNQWNNRRRQGHASSYSMENLIF